jgi:hypothetical protein
VEEEAATAAAAVVVRQVAANSNRSTDIIETAVGNERTGRQYFIAVISLPVLCDCSILPLVFVCSVVFSFALFG